MSRPGIRALVTNAGSGSSGNVIRALRRIAPPCRIVGINDDRFTLGQSSADRNYLCPAPGAKSFIDAMLEVVRRERVNVIVPTDDSYSSDAALSAFRQSVDRAGELWSIYLMEARPTIPRR